MFLEVLVPSLINGMLARELTPEQKAKILENGLYHFTSEESANKILDKNGIAHFKPSDRISSYSMLGRKSVFMFAGKPSVFDIVRNIKGFNLDKVKDKRFIHIKGEDALNIVEKLKYRPTDYATMFPGELNIPAQVMTFEQVFEKELKNSIEEKTTFLDDFKKAFSNTIGNGYKELYNKIKGSLEYEIARYNVLGKWTASQSQVVENEYENSCNVEPGKIIKDIEVNKNRFISIRDGSITVYNNDMFNRLNGQQQTIYIKEGSNITYDGNTQLKINDTVIDLTKVNNAELQYFLRKNDSVEAIEIANYKKGMLHSADGPSKMMYSIDEKGNMILENKLYSFEGYCLEEEEMKKNIPTINTPKTQKELLRDKDVLARSREAYLDFENYSNIYKDKESLQFRHNYNLNKHCNYEITNKFIKVNQKDKYSGESYSHTYYFKNNIFHNGDGIIYVNGKEINLESLSRQRLQMEFISSKDISAFEYEKITPNKGVKNVLPSKVIYELDDDTNKINVAKALYNANGTFYGADDIKKIIPSVFTYKENPKMQLEKKDNLIKDNSYTIEEKPTKQSMKEIVNGLLERINKNNIEKSFEEESVSLENSELEF